MSERSFFGRIVLKKEFDDRMTPGTPARAMLSSEEVKSRISAFSEADWMRVRRASEYWAKARNVDPDDLLQSALVRAIDGSRQCPADVPMLRFLAQAMRSIASDEKKANVRRGELHLVAEDGELIFDPADERPNPAQTLESEQEVKRIKDAFLGLFEGDLIGQTIVEGDMDGMEGEELRALTGLDLKAFASKRRLIRRRIDKAFPKGWIS